MSISIIVNVLFFTIPAIAIFAAILAGLRSMTKTGSGKKALRTHFITLGVMVTLLLGCTMGVSAAGEAAEAVQTAAQSSASAGMGMLSAGLCTGLAGIGGGIALASGVPAAIGATSENPKAFGKALIFVALGETIALYGFIMSFMILSRI